MNSLPLFIQDHAFMHFWNKVTPAFFCLWLAAAPVAARDFRLQPADGESTAGGLRFGFGLGRYTHHVSGPEIYMWRINNGYIDGTTRILEVSDKFSSMQDFRKADVIFEAARENIMMEVSYATRFKLSDARYTYDNGPNSPVSNRYEKTKMSINTLTFSVGYRPEPISSLSIGTGMDLGMLRAKIKVEDELGGNTGWEPWFWNVKILSKDLTAKTPVAGWSFYAMYDLKFISLRITHVAAILNGSMNSGTNKYSNIPWSKKMFPIGHTAITAYFHLNAGS